MTSNLIYVTAEFITVNDDFFIATLSNVCGLYNISGATAPTRSVNYTYERTFPNTSNSDYYGGGGYYGGGRDRSGSDSMNNVTPSNFTGTDIVNYLNNYSATTNFCTAFNSNDFNTDTAYFNMTIFKDTGNNFFSDANPYLSFTSSNFLNRVGYNALTYCMTDPTTVGGSNPSWAFVMVKSVFYRRFPYGGIEEPVPGVIYPDPITIFYSYRNGTTKQMSVRGLNGQYSFGNTEDNVISNADGISIANNPTNTKMYILPYDQYTLDAQANSGSNLYVVNLSNDPNPDSSDLGFTQGTIVHRFTGVPNTFATVNIVSSNIVLLKQPNSATVYYISSSNLITSNSNYVLYNTQVLPISQTLNFYLGNIASIIAAPQTAVFLGQNYYFAGDQFTIPKYIRYTQGISYYSTAEYGYGTDWLYDNDGQIGALLTGYFYCNSEGTLYQQTNIYEGGKTRVTNLLAFNVAGKGTYINTSYYLFPNVVQRGKPPNDPSNASLVTWIPRDNSPLFDVASPDCQ
jgi:hypothetical protein